MALGANAINMAFAGVLAAYLPYRLWGTHWRSAAIFTSGLLSVLVSACLALSELAFSGVPMPRRVLWLSLGLFVVSGVLEGAITLGAEAAMLKAHDYRGVGDSGEHSIHRLKPVPPSCPIRLQVAAMPRCATAPRALRNSAGTLSA
jgi:hypothetical protein